MRSTRLGTVLAAGLAFAAARPADAQVTFNLGGNGRRPGVTIGQPNYGNGYAYGQPYYNNGYAFGRPGYYTNDNPYPGRYYAPGYSNLYSSGYRGVYGPAPAPTYGASGYYAPQPGTSYCSGYAAPYDAPRDGVYRNVPAVGPVRVR